MNRVRLFELVRAGESSSLEFKRDGLRIEALAKELVAFLNLEGGTVLIGVEDDGSISGTHRDNLEEWVAEACRTKIEPPIIPLMSWMRNVERGRDVLVVAVPPGPDKPYARIHNNRNIYYIRVGSTSREASREELGRMYQASGRLRYGAKPVPGAGLEALDRRRLRDYLTHVLGWDTPEDEDLGGWESLLQNLKIMTVSMGSTSPPLTACSSSGNYPRGMYRNPGFGPSAIQEPSRTTQLAPTKFCEDRWFRSPPLTVR